MKSDLDMAAPKGRRHDRLTSLAVAVTGGILVAALWRFNQAATGYEYYLVGNAMALFFAPMMLVLLLGHHPSDFGFAVASSRRVRWITVLLFGILLALLVPASRLSTFQDYYPIFRRFEEFRGGIFREGDVWGLAYGWASYGMYLFFWEFFFRGYLLFGLARTIRWPAVIVQAIPFCLLHWNKPTLEMAGSLVAGIVLGMLALRARSFLPCFVLHWAASVAFDVLVLVRR